MTSEELRNDYGNEICELCCREYFTSRAYPESLCEGQFKSALFWLNTSNTKKNILHAKDSINMAIKELED